MAKSTRMTVSAAAGNASFEITDLHNLWAALNDRNYWTAFRMLTRILDDLVNPTTGKTQLRGFTLDRDGYKVDDICMKLEDWRDRAYRTETARTVAAPATPGSMEAAIDPFVIIGLVDMFLKLLEAWRKRRNPPEPENRTMNQKPTLPPFDPSDPNANQPQQQGGPQLPEGGAMTDSGQKESNQPGVRGTSGSGDNAIPVKQDDPSSLKGDKREPGKQGEEAGQEAGEQVAKDEEGNEEGEEDDSSKPADSKAETKKINVRRPHGKK